MPHTHNHQSMEILFQNQHMVAINKPNGLLVHRTVIATDAQEFALQLLRNQLGQPLYPVHRLDRPTSGVLLFALHRAAAAQLQIMLQNGQIKKQYVALLRGWLKEESIEVEHPVKNENGNEQSAHTLFRVINRYCINHPVGPYPEARFTQVELFPTTGRWHQIRQHAAHLRHYIVNDRVHGCRHNNRLFASQLNITQLFLHARQLSFAPSHHFPLHIEAPFPPHWAQFDALTRGESPQNSATETIQM